MDHNKLWKILKEMGITDHLTCFLRNLYAGQETTVRIGYGTLFNFFAEWKWKSLTCVWLFATSWTIVHGILQARTGVLSFPFSRGSSQPMDWTQVPHIAGGFFTSWATRENQKYRSRLPIPSQANLPNPGIELGSPELQADSLPTELWGKSSMQSTSCKILG